MYIERIVLDDKLPPHIKVLTEAEIYWSIDQEQEGLLRKDRAITQAAIDHAEWKKSMEDYW